MHSCTCYLAGLDRAAVQWLMQQRSNMRKNLTTGNLPPSTTVTVFEEHVRQLHFSQCGSYLVALTGQQIAVFQNPSGKAIWSQSLASLTQGQQALLQQLQEEGPEFSCTALHGCHSSLHDIAAVGWSSGSNGDEAAGNIHVLKLNICDGALLQYSILPVYYSMLPPELDGCTGSIDVMPVFSPGGSFVAVPVCLQDDNADGMQGGDALMIVDMREVEFLPVLYVQRGKYTPWSNDLPLPAWSPDQTKLYFMGQLAYVREGRLYELADAKAFDREQLANSSSAFDRTSRLLGFSCKFDGQDSVSGVIFDSSPRHKLILPNCSFIQFLSSQSCALLSSSTYYLAFIWSLEQQAIVRSFPLHTDFPVLTLDDRIIFGRPFSAYVQKVFSERSAIVEGQSFSLTTSRCYWENKHGFCDVLTQAAWEMDGISSAPVLSQDDGMLAYAGPMDEENEGDSGDDYYSTEQRQVHLVKLW